YRKAGSGVDAELNARGPGEAGPADGHYGSSSAHVRGDARNGRSGVLVGEPTGAVRRGSPRRRGYSNVYPSPGLSRGRGGGDLRVVDYPDVGSGAIAELNAGGAREASPRDGHRRAAGLVPLTRIDVGDNRRPGQVVHQVDGREGVKLGVIGSVPQV